MNQSARDEVLGRIRSALGERDHASETLMHETYELLPRGYAQSSSLTRGQVIELLEERLRDYDAEVSRVTDAAVASVLDSLLPGAVKGPVIVPEDFPAQWLPQGRVVTSDAAFEAAALDRFEAVITTATLAIADTGSFVLQRTSGQGRRALSLVPDVHFCVVRVEDIVQTVPEAFHRLQNTAALPTTFVSGPSATADIEMTRIKGVHGPRSLYVLLVFPGGAEESLHPPTDQMRTVDEER